MSFHVFFSMSTGLKKSMRVPKGTKARIAEHVQDVEETFGFKTTQYLKNPPHWVSTRIPDSVDDTAACELVSEHNDFVRCLYADMARWQKKPPADYETITPSQAAKFWHALVDLDLPPSRWTDEFYRERMDWLYEVMRGRESEGASFGAPPLTPKQAEAVVIMISHWLDPGDARLAVCEGEDRLTDSPSEGYAWCSECGAISHNDAEDKIRNCHKLKDGGCDVRNEYADIYGIDPDEDEPGEDE